MARLLNESEINRVKKEVFLALKEHIEREIATQIKKILEAKKRDQYEKTLSYL